MSFAVRMPSRDELDEVFARPPIREVAFEIRFTPHLRVPAEIWRLQDELVRRYPEVGKESVIQPTGALIDVAVFADPGGGRLIKVSHQNFMIAFSRYSRFEDFKAEVLNSASRFCSIFGIETLTRIGLRYVNEITLPTREPSSLLTYVRPVTNFDRFPLDLVEQFATEIRTHYKDHLVTIRTVLLPGVLRTYVLDIDCHTEESRSAAEYPALLDRFHDSAQILFLDHVTDEYKDVMRGKT